MTDINDHDSKQPGKNSSPERGRYGPAGLTSAELVELIELFFFAYRDFTQDPDTLLEEFGFGRAHHRVLHFVNHYPGMRVADLLELLKITKQSLARVLKQMIDEGMIEQQPGKADRRERRLYATSRGRELAVRLLEPQMQRFARALDLSGIENTGEHRKFLFHLINSTERNRVLELLKRPEMDKKQGDS